MFCNQLPAFAMGRQYCGEVYRNPQGSAEANNEYIRIDHRGRWRFSIKPLEKK
jgi:hypothetical protein